MKLFRHPVHPPVVAFPLAMLASTPGWDLLAITGVLPDGRIVAYYSLCLGLAAGVLALVTGVLDLMAVPSPSAVVMRTALTHATLAFSTLCLDAFALVARVKQGGTVTPLVIGLESVAALAILVTGWFGGHLVFEHGVGVRRRE